MKKVAFVATAVVALLFAGAGYAHWGFGGWRAAPAWGYGMPMMGPGMMGYWGYGYGFGELSEEQRAEIQEKIEELQKKGAYPWEIHAEVFKLLQKFGKVGNGTAVPGYGYAPYYGCPMWGYGW